VRATWPIVPRVTTPATDHFGKIYASIFADICHRRTEALGQLAREIEQMEGVSAMWPTGDYAALGLPAPADHSQVADVMFEAAPGYSSGDADAAEDEHGAPKYLGTHGQRPVYADNAAFFLAPGAGIARGRGIEQIRSRDVAPTVARVLGLALGAVEGNVVEEALG